MILDLMRLGRKLRPLGRSGRDLGKAVAMPMVRTSTWKVAPAPINVSGFPDSTLPASYVVLTIVKRRVYS